MPERELWLTAIFNHYLAGLYNSVLALFNQKAESPARPWENWLVYEFLVVAIIMVLVAVLRAKLSVENPGKLQHLFELYWEFIKGQAHEVGVHHATRYAPYFATAFLFILLMNLIGIIPGFESPTQTAAVPLGMAVCTFVYYNTAGIRELGGKYFAHFVGPIWQLFILMIPLEIVSHLARLLSLTFRLFGNMLAGEQVTGVFTSLTYIVIPVIFMGLHVFVAFLQAYVFMLLTMIYVAFATSHEH